MLGDQANAGTYPYREMSTLQPISPYNKESRWERAVC